MSLSLFPGVANAIVGNGVQSLSAGDAPAVCEILIDQFIGQSWCSGSLISPTRVVTAAHCFGRNFKLKRSNLTVRCGGRDLGQVSALNSPDPSDRSIWVKNDAPTHAADVATLELMRATNLPPVAMAQSLVDFFDTNMTPYSNVRCKIMGFGADNYGSHGVLHQADVSKLNLNFIDRPRAVLEGQEIYLSPRGTPFLLTSADHGDSGGPFLCQKDDLEFKLVGVIGGFDYDGSTSKKSWNFIRPIWTGLP